MKGTVAAGGRRYMASAHGHGGKDHGHGHGDHGHGHDDHGHHEPFEVPHYTKYNNWTISPELVAHQQRLQVLGLNDPWIRNYAWIYHPNIRHHWGYTKLMRALFGGVKYGALTAGIAILVTEGYSYFKKKDSPDEHEHH